jgi:hypothetical protein
MMAASWVDGALVECTWRPHQIEILIKAELAHLREAYEQTGWEIEDVDTAYTALTEAEGLNLFVFVGPNVLCLCEDKPWFSKERVVYEEFIGQGIGLATVVEIMAAVCKMTDCKRYVAGTRAAANQRHAGLAKLYSKEGLTISAIELMGVVSIGKKDKKGSGQV